MSEKELSRYEMEKCKIEIEMKKNYYGAFVTNVLKYKQIQKIENCEAVAKRKNKSISNY